MNERESSVERAAQSVHVAVADFVIAIQEARTSGDALMVRGVVAEVVGALLAAEDAALRRADALCQ